MDGLCDGCHQMFGIQKIASMQLGSMVHEVDHVRWKVVDEQGLMIDDVEKESDMRTRS